MQKSGAFGFATQMVKLGSQFLTAEPKAYLSCALVQPLMTYLFNLEPHPNEKIKNNEKTVIIGNSKVSFKGLGQPITNGLSKGIAKFFNWEPLQKASGKFKDTNFAQFGSNLAKLDFPGKSIPAIPNASGPEIRIIAVAPSPAGVAIAHIVFIVTVVSTANY